MNTLRNRCALYIRVSSLDQNPDLQHRELIDYAKTRNWQISKIYEDRLTGTNANRKSLQQLLNDARQRRFDILLMWKLDRGFRSIRDCINYLQEFNDLGIQFVSLKDSGIDMTLPSGRLLLHILAAFSEFEASILKMRVKSGLDAARARGVRLGRPIRVTPEIIEEVKRLRSQNISIRQIGKRVQLAKSTVQRILDECTDIPDSAKTKKVNDSNG